MTPSNLALCYEGIQRHYRNAMVRFLRTQLSRAFPTDFSERLRKPFNKEEWDKIAMDAHVRRDTGELNATIKDEFDLLSVNHFSNIFECYFDEVCSAIASSSKYPEKTKQKQTLLQWMRSIKNLRDPLSHPSEEDFSFEDAFALLDAARRTLQQLKLEDFKAVKEIMDELRGRPASISSDVETIEDRLPPRENIVVEFVGRQKELDILWQWFSDPSSRRWALAGDGGKGKSALAYKFATEVKFKSKEQFQIILWISAKRRRFQEGRIVGVDIPDFNDLESALTQILLHYGWSEEASSRSMEEKRLLVIELLNNFPALLIVDDIDSLEGEEEAAIEFFSLFVPQTRSKVLFTSRRTLFGMGATTTSIKGLDDEDARKFVMSRCTLMELDRNAIIPHLAEIIRAAEGSPLFLEDILRLCAVLDVKTAIKAWTEKKGTEARKYALGRELEMLSPRARAVLVAACFRSTGATYLELQAVTGLSDDVQGSALNELQRLFLVPKPRLIEGEQRYIVNLNTRTLVRQIEERSDLWRRTEAAYKAIAGEIPRVHRADISATIRKALFLSRNKQFYEAEKTLQEGLSKHPNDPDLISFLAGVYKSWVPPRITDARDHFYRAWQLRCANENSYKHWAQMEMDQREWARAVEAAERGIQQVGPKRILLWLCGYAKSRYGKDLLARTQTTDAVTQLNKSREYHLQALKNPQELVSGEDRRLNAEIYRSLVLTCEALKDISGMEQYFEAWYMEHPDDSMFYSEWERLAPKYHFSIKGLISQNVSKS